MGSVRRRGPGAWEAQVRVNGEQRTRTYRLPHTRRGRHEAERRVAEWQSEVDEQSTEMSHLPTIAEAGRRWFTASRPKWKPNTERLYRRSLDTIVETFGCVLLTELDPVDVTRWLNDLELSRNSKNIHKTVLSALCTFAVDEGVLRTNPIKRVHIAAEVGVVDKVAPDADAIRRTVNGQTDPRWRAFAVTAATTGMRQGELCALRWVDVSPTTLHVRANLSDGKLTTPKNGKSRKVSITADVHEALTSWRKHQGEHPEFVFSTDGRSPLSTSTVSTWWLRSRRVESLRFHDLRHNVATQLLAAGFDVVTVAARLGQDPTVTLATYAHAIPARDVAAADTMSGLLGL